MEGSASDALEKRIGFVYRQHALSLDIAQGKGQEPRGKDVAIRGDKNDPFAVPCGNERGPGWRRWRPKQVKEFRSKSTIEWLSDEVMVRHAPLPGGSLRDDPPEKGCLDGSYPEPVTRSVDEELTHLFVDGCAGCRELGAAACVDEKKQFPDINPLPLDYGGDLSQVLKIRIQDGGVDLYCEAMLPQQLDTLYGGLERAGDTSQGIMSGSRRPIKAEGSGFDLMGSQLFEDGRFQARRDRRSDGDWDSM